LAGDEAAGAVVMAIAYPRLESLAGSLSHEVCRLISDAADSPAATISAATALVAPLLCVDTAAGAAALATGREGAAHSARERAAAAWLEHFNALCRQYGSDPGWEVACRAAFFSVAFEPLAHVLLPGTRNVASQLAFPSC
jgi:hypothetical protein